MNYYPAFVTKEIALSSLTREKVLCYRFTSILNTFGRAKCCNVFLLQEVVRLLPGLAGKGTRWLQPQVGGVAQESGGEGLYGDNAAL